MLLQALERFNRVVIFATNMAASFDPAFERRIRPHIRFEMPGALVPSLEAALPVALVYALAQ